MDQITAADSDCQRLLRSLRLNTHVRKFNVYTSLVLILVGTVANSLGVFVFVQRRYRKQHSSFIYLLFLCLCDALFLVVHLFEDTLRTLIDVHDQRHNAELAANACKSSSPAFNGYDEYRLDFVPSDHALLRLVNQLNLVDSFELPCQSVNFLRYFLRFLSAYLIVAFTLQRSFAIRFPLQSHTLESTRIVKYIIIGLVALGVSLNAWIPSYFHLMPVVKSTQNNNTPPVLSTYCDVERDFGHTYFYFTFCYVLAVVLFPIFIIFISNSYIIHHVIDSQKKRGLIIVNNTTSRHRHAHNSTECNAPTRNFLLVSNDSEELSSLHSTSGGDRLMMRVMNRSSNSTRSLSFCTPQHASSRITRMLLLMSFSYALLNLPYLIAWSVFVYKVAFQQSADVSLRHDLNSALQMCEILYVANYAGHFFIYCFSGKRFRRMLSKSLEFKSFRFN